MNAGLMAADQRDELLRLATGMFATEPYEEISLTRVAELAGTPRGLVYHCFGGKDRLLAAVVEAETAELLSRTEPDPTLPPVPRMRAVLDAYVDFVAARPHGYRTMHRRLSSAPAIRSAVEYGLRCQECRLLDALTRLDGGTELSPAVRLVVRGWLACTVETCLAWLDDPALSRTALRDLFFDTLAGALSAAGYRVPEE